MPKPHMLAVALGLSLIAASGNEAWLRVTDAMTLAPGAALVPQREIVRRAECLSGSVRLAWSIEPRFHFGTKPTRIERRGRRLVEVSKGEALGLGAWDAGDPQVNGGRIQS